MLKHGKVSNTSAASTDVDKANMLNKFFVSQSEQSASPGSVPSIVEPATNKKLHDNEYTVYEVQALLSRLDPTKSPGDDGIPTRILRTFARDVAPQVFHLF